MSECTGETADAVLKSALSQFGAEKFDLLRIPAVDDHQPAAQPGILQGIEAETLGIEQVALAILDVMVESMGQVDRKHPAI